MRLRLSETRVTTVALFLLLIAAFYIVNHGAFRGYFQDDDLDNFNFTREIGLSDFLTPLVIPRVFDDNFRPVGHIFYRFMGEAFGLHFAPYIIFIQALHLVNVALLWLLLRRLGLPYLAAWVGAVFFAFHMAAFDVFWKPMYVFDLLCGFFCLLSMLSYVSGRWVIGVLFMWLGYRSKEVAIMLPVVLAVYEFLLGEKRWRRLIPYFALSLILGVQALVQNHQHQENAYTLHLNAQTLWTCLQFYASRVFLIPYAGFAVLLLLLVRDRRVLFGLIAFGSLLVPMLLLPGRLFSPYLYVPLTGLAIAAAALAEHTPPAVIAAFFALWLPWNFINMRQQRKVALADSYDRQAYVRRLADFSHAHPGVLTFIATHGPVNGYGTEGVLHFLHSVGAKIGFAFTDDPHAKQIALAYPIALLNWDVAHHDLVIQVRTANSPDASFIRAGIDSPFGQLEAGWFDADNNFRWIQPDATAKLQRPPDARTFELTVNVGPALLERNHHSQVTIRLNGELLGTRDFTNPGYETVDFPIPNAPAGPAQISFHAAPAFEIPNSPPLGIAIVSFGFR